MRQHRALPAKPGADLVPGQRARREQEGGERGERDDESPGAASRPRPRPEHVRGQVLRERRGAALDERTRASSPHTVCRASLWLDQTRLNAVVASTESAARASAEAWQRPKGRPEAEGEERQRADRGSEARVSPAVGLEVAEVDEDERATRARATIASRDVRGRGARARRRRQEHRGDDEQAAVTGEDLVRRRTGAARRCRTSRCLLDRRIASACSGRRGARALRTPPSRRRRGANAGDEAGEVGEQPPARRARAGRRRRRPRSGRSRTRRGSRPPPRARPGRAGARHASRKAPKPSSPAGMCSKLVGGERRDQRPEREGHERDAAVARARSPRSRVRRGRRRGGRRSPPRAGVPPRASRCRSRHADGRRGSAARPTEARAARAPGPCRSRGALRSSRSRPSS